VLVRHGATDWSGAGQHTGRTDVPLNAALGARLSTESFDLVLTSPLSRAVETCRLAGLADSAVIVDDLQEWDYGDYEGLTTAEIRAGQTGWTVFADGCPGGETAADVGRRADAVLASLAADDGLAAAGGGRVAVFGHGHMLRILASRWLGMDAAVGRLLALAPASVSRLGWEHETRIVDSWNS